MTAPRWFLADLRTGRQILDLPVLAGSWERFLGAPESLNATLDMRDPDTIALRPRIAAAPGRTILACAAGDVILAAGPIWAHSYMRDQMTLKLVAAGIWSYFDHRYVLPIAAATVSVSEFVIPDGAAAGKTKPNPALGTYLTNLEYGTIAKRWVEQAQAWTGGSVPVVFEADRVGTKQRNFEGADFKNLGTVLTQLSQIEGGPDIRFFPRLTGDRLGIEFLLQTGTDASPLLAGGPHQWDVTAPESAVSNFQVNVDATGMAGTAWATAGRSADTVLVARSIDPKLTDAGYPLLETLDSSHTTVSEQATLNAYAAEATLLGRSPAETWDFDVEAGQQPFLGSFWEGDWCDVTVAGYDPGSYIPPTYTDWVEQRRNHNVNPRMDNSTTGWSVGAVTQTPQPGGTQIDFPSGLGAATGFFLQSTSAVAVPGQVWSGSMEFTVPVGYPAITIRFDARGYTGGTSGSIGSSPVTTINPGQTIRLSATSLPLVAGSNGARTVVTSPIGISIPAGARLIVRDALLEEAPIAGPFFSGATADEELTRCSWTSTPDNSPSILETREIVTPEIILPAGGGDPYLYEKQESRRRITYLAGDQDGLTVSVKTVERV